MTLEWTPPKPPYGVVSTPASDVRAQTDRFFGFDLWFDIAGGSRANLVVTAAGDWRVVGGVTALAQSLTRRTITNPGEWRTKPNYGVGARDFVKAKDTPATRAQLEARVREQYLADRRVERVDAVAIERVETAMGPVLRLGVKFTPRGRLRTDAPIQLSIDVT
jgi:phage baseplate assembly protein W